MNKMRTKHEERGNFLIFKLTALVVGVLVSGVLVSCVPQSRAPIKIKVLSLNPDEYIGSKVQIQGTVSGVGLAESYLVVEDDTGRILVGTEQIAQKTGCSGRSKVELVGTLRRLKSLPQPYFSMENLLSCKP
ncbi:MAG: hypothetical protein FJY29_12925 [Betaproteobacteria bacterium]|nr:hypothetical protein [Betaproteobacteria bacterium]